jgi:competence protein ComEA
MTLKDRRNRRFGWLLAAALSALAPVAGAAEVGAAPAPAINLNTASATELEQLPGVGEARARAIVEAREKRGGFKNVEELVDVKGIGKAAVEKLRPLVTLGSSKNSAPR